MRATREWHEPIRSMETDLRSYNKTINRTRINTKAATAFTTAKVSTSVRSYNKTGTNTQAATTPLPRKSPYFRSGPAHACVQIWACVFFSFLFLVGSRRVDAPFFFFFFTYSSHVDCSRLFCLSRASPLEHSGAVAIGYSGQRSRLVGVI